MKSLSLIIVFSLLVAATLGQPWVCPQQYAINYIYSPGPPCKLTIGDKSYVCASWNDNTMCVPDPAYPGQPVICAFVVYTGNQIPQGCEFIFTQYLEDVCWPKTTENCPGGGGTSEI